MAGGMGWQAIPPNIYLLELGWSGPGCWAGALGGSVERGRDCLVSGFCVNTRGRSEAGAALITTMFIPPHQSSAAKR